MLPFIGRVPVNSQILAIEIPVKNKNRRKYQQNRSLQALFPENPCSGGCLARRRGRRPAARA
jgi:hypothetical protein